MRAKFPYRKRKKRLGFGPGSGHGKTSTKGHKGQRARSGFSIKRGFEGGQTPLYRRIPKRGFNNYEFRTEYAIVNLDTLVELETAEITPELLVERGVIKNLKSGIKVLANGEIKSPLTVKAHKFSEAAKAKIEKAGGKALVV